ncbi:MAG: hypothetical protein AABZ30_15145 [Myxococcota bacterium]
MADVVAEHGQEPVHDVTAGTHTAGAVTHETPPDPRAPNIRRGLWYFFIANVISFAAMAGIYQLIWHGDFMNPGFEAVYRYFSRHETQAVLAAAMPFFASMLVGFGYARRAARRRARTPSVG